MSLLRQMAATQLSHLVEDRIKGLLSTYEEVLLPSERERLNRGVWMTLYSAANRLSECRGENRVDDGYGAYPQNVSSLAGDALHRVINDRLRSLCRYDLLSIVESIGGEAQTIYDAYNEGLTTESELLMKLIVLLTSPDSPEELRIL